MPGRGKPRQGRAHRNLAPAKSSSSRQTLRAGRPTQGEGMAQAHVTRWPGKSLTLDRPLQRSPLAITPEMCVSCQRDQREEQAPGYTTISPPAGASMPTGTWTGGVPTDEPSPRSPRSCRGNQVGPPFISRRR